MLINSVDINKLKVEKARKRLAELERPEGQLIEYPDGRVYRNDELIAEDAGQEQEQWVKRRMHGSAKSWEVWDQ